MMDGPRLTFSSGQKYLYRKDYVESRIVMMQHKGDYK
jgi:hypothetical protein